MITYKGYKAKATKDELTERLGIIEDKIPDMLDQICGDYCRNTDRCGSCPMSTVKYILEGEEQLYV